MDKVKVGDPIRAKVHRPYKGHIVHGKVITVHANSFIVDLKSGQVMEFDFADLGDTIWILPTKSDIDRSNIRQIESVTKDSALNRIVVSYINGKDIDFIKFSPERFEEIKEIERVQKEERFKRCGEAMDKLYLSADKFTQNTKGDSNMLENQGKRVRTKEGAQRDSSEGRGRFDLFPFEAMEALAIWFEKGASRYGDRDWELGSSVKDAINRMIRHAIKAGNGWTDEDHLAAVMWNAACAITMAKRRPDCNDHPWKGELLDKDELKKDFELAQEEVKEIHKENSMWKKANPVILADEIHETSKQPGGDIYVDCCNTCKHLNNVGKIYCLNDPNISERTNTYSKYCSKFELSPKVRASNKSQDHIDAISYAVEQKLNTDNKKDKAKR